MKRTKRTFFAYTAAILVCCLTPQAGAETLLGSGFTYQGQLKLAGGVLNDTADFEFTLWDADVEGNITGQVVAVSDVDVVDGLFTVELDFGAEPFTGKARWLQIAVRSPHDPGDAQPFTPLDPRTPLTAAPYALALPAFRTEQHPSSPNVIGGNAANSVAAGTFGATIAGGGSNVFENLITENFGSIGGGWRNTSGNSAVVAGGYRNTASGQYSAVPGGDRNKAAGDASFAAGTRAEANHSGAFVWADGSDSTFASTADNQFLIQAAGGVGIGTNAPTTALDVAGTVKATSFAGDGSALTDLPGVWSESGANISYDAGNVGIGNNDPSATLDVVGTTELNGDVDVEGNVRINDNDLHLRAGGDVNHGLGWYGGGKPFADVELEGPVLYGFHGGSLGSTSGDAQRVLTWRNSGKVGIGTDAPTTTLDVAGTVTATFFAGDGSALTNLPVAEGAWDENGGNIFYEAGNVGIGTDSPQAILQVRSKPADSGVFNAETTAGAMFTSATHNGGDTLAAPEAVLVLAREGVSGQAYANFARFDLSRYEENGSTSRTQLDIRLSHDNLTAGGEANNTPTALSLRSNGDVTIYNNLTVDTDTLFVKAQNGSVGIGTTNPQAKLDVNGSMRTQSLVVNGWTTTQVLEITGGSDIAEPYDVAPYAQSEPIPGMVVSIDPTRLGKMRVSGVAYDRKVAGIISGANGVMPGLTLTQKGTVADGALPVASVGRVWCWCDADAGGPINAGDLLTSSATPGHAMTAGNVARSQGAIIGKAMSSLSTGRGMVLVLVSLQ